jgi:hypothetical protein
VDVPWNGTVVSGNLHLAPAPNVSYKRRCFELRLDLHQEPAE